MTGTSNNNIQAHSPDRRSTFRLFFMLLICSILILAGCVHISSHEQRLVSKPNMQFSGNEIFSYQDKLLTQFESGSASFTGGQAGDCGSCAGGGQ